MSMAPRIGVLAFLLMAATFTPTASASGCVEVEYRSFGNGLHVIADTGRELAFGFTTGLPGDGIGAVLIITPALCGGVGAGWYDVPSVPRDPVDLLEPTLHDAMLLLPLP